MPEREYAFIQPPLSLSGFSGVYIPVWQEVCINKAFFLSFIRAIALASASGYRIYTSGDLTVVGSYGYYWSSSPYASGNANGGSLSFTPSDVTLLGGLQRARGFSVRCVQYLQTAFFKVKAEKRKVKGRKFILE
ncbi:MAG: fibrobacter succinogenes major paralogous domain-containing protein [Alistipes sp.]|nr:fibrobacter succinogenes major paralogous domain-containing protein [Alistipes sp.]